MGKSAAAKLLEQKGCSVIDTDILARQVVELGQPALQEIQARFGAGVLDVAGGLRREELAKRVFGDAAARKDLEAIVHPRIRERWKKEVEIWRGEDRRIGVVVIPLLFETGAAAEFDKIICLACSSATQLKRLRARGWSEEQIQQRIASQAPIQAKITLSHFVVWTEASQMVHSEQLERILARLSMI
jgi:dephospho-CoA kinase